MSRVDNGLRPLFRKHVPRPCHWQSVETGQIARGVPDSNFCADGVEGWIEMKATRGMSVHMRPEQIGWLLTRARHGGRTFVAVRRHVIAGTRRNAADELWLFDGAAAEMLKTGGMATTAAAPSGSVPYSRGRLLRGRWLGGPARWDWPAVRLAMLA